MHFLLTNSQRDRFYLVDVCISYTYVGAFSLYYQCLYLVGGILHPGVVVDLHTGLRVDVLGADNLTVSLQGLQLEELSSREKLERRI